MSLSQSRLVATFAGFGIVFGVAFNHAEAGKLGNLVNKARQAAEQNTLPGGGSALVQFPQGIGTVQEIKNGKTNGGQVNGGGLKQKLKTGAGSNLNRFKDLAKQRLDQIGPALPADEPAGNAGAPADEIVLDPAQVPAGDQVDPAEAEQAKKQARRDGIVNILLGAWGSRNNGGLSGGLGDAFDPIGNGSVIECPNGIPTDDTGELPAEERPADETPVEEMPAEETPVDDAGEALGENTDNFLNDQFEAELKMATEPPTGLWKANPKKGMSVQLALKPGQKFAWLSNTKGTMLGFSGKYSVKGNTLTLERADGVKMAGNFTMKGEDSFTFRLANASKSDPTLTFKR